MLAQAVEHLTVEHLIKNIVHFRVDVSLKSHENARGELIRVRENPEDSGRVIGRNGRSANAIRTVVQALADHKVSVDIMDVRKCKGAEGTLKTVAPKKDAATLVEEADTKAQKLKAAKAEAEIKANENATVADAAAEQKADEKVEFADAEESAPEAV